MQIIKPNKNISKLVEELTPQLEEDIKGMEQMMKDQKFENNRKGYAVAHCQVSEDPYQISVAKEGMLPVLVFLNPVIIESTGTYITRELCLSFPNKGPEFVNRFKKIKVSFLDRYMQKHTIVLEGMQAQIVQHEIQHFLGRNIYDK